MGVKSYYLRYILDILITLLLANSSLKNEMNEARSFIHFIIVNVEKILIDAMRHGISLVLCMYSIDAQQNIG